MCALYCMTCNTDQRHAGRARPVDARRERAHRVVLPYYKGCTALDHQAESGTPFVLPRCEGEHDRGGHAARASSRRHAALAVQGIRPQLRAHLCGVPDLRDVGARFRRFTLTGRSPTAEARTRAPHASTAVDPVDRGPCSALGVTGSVDGATGYVEARPASPASASLRYRTMRYVVRCAARSSRDQHHIPRPTHATPVWQRTCADHAPSPTQ
jgi:hypothetical protein